MVTNVPLVSVLRMGEAGMHQGKVGMRHLYLPLNFFCKPRTALKNNKVVKITK